MLDLYQWLNEYWFQLWFFVAILPDKVITLMVLKKIKAINNSQSEIKRESDKNRYDCKLCAKPQKQW